MSADYDAAMLARLRASKTEASKVVLDLYKSGRRMSDAVLDAIESMPRTKTAQLRRWSDNWKAFLEWMDLQARRHWEVVKITHNRVWVNVPSDQFGHTYDDEFDAANVQEAVAAGADVRTVKFVSQDRLAKYPSKLTGFYEIVSRQ